MSSFLYNGMQDDLPMDADTKTFRSNIGVFQYVNPQETDIQYSSSRDSHRSTICSGLMTPPQTTIDFSARPPSLIISNTADSYDTGPGSASSASSSFRPSPGYASSCPSSVSTASSSRRHSAIYMDTQQQCYLSPGSPTPLFRSGSPKEPWNIDQQPLQHSFHADDYGTVSNTTSFTTASDCLIDGPNENLFGATSAHMAWEDQQLGHFGMQDYDLAGRTNLPACFTVDLVPRLNQTLGPRSLEYPETALKSPQASIFPNVVPQQGHVLSHVDPDPSPSMLQPVLKHEPTSHSDYMSSSDYSEEDISRNKRKRVSGNLPKTSIGRGNPIRKPKNNICPFCTEDETPGGKPYACNRPEHLKRHVKAKHPDEAGIEQELFVCKFADCLDKNRNRKIIVARNDNFKAHYNKTHFSYGNTEKSGKNTRKSMKMSIAEGLRAYDARWTMMLSGKMKVGEDAKTSAEGKTGQIFMSIWKMIGYSIKETRELKVKDIAPEWKGPDDTRLEELDCRWKALKDKTLTYEQAMSVGANMKETPRQGLLGVDMAESKAMGLVSEDPRWQMLLSGQMTVEDAENLGVREFARQVKRKR